MLRSKLLMIARGMSMNARSFSTTRKLGMSGHGKFFYREQAVAGKEQFIAAEIMGAFMWWWIFWHLFTDYGHIIGEFEFPDVSKWTDGELGIPPDSED